MTTKPFAFWTVPGDSPQATKPVADHILKLEAELAHLRSLLTPGLNVIDARMAELRAERDAARRLATDLEAECNKLRNRLRSLTPLERSMIEMLVHARAETEVAASDHKEAALKAHEAEQRAREAEAERDLLRAQLAKVVQERDAARTLLDMVRALRS